MAVSRYQFESIHPFTDGNGRTGRILNILYRVQNGLIDIPILYPTFLSMVKIAPAAFFNSLFRPHLLEAKNPLMLLSAFENLLIIFCLIISLAFHSKKNKNWHLIYFCMTIVVLLFILVGITTPILGAAVRYKMPALPFLLIAFVLIVDKDKIVQKFPFLKKRLHGR